MNQIEAQKELKKLKLQVEKLEAIVNKPTDMFTIKTYSDVCKELGESEFTEADFENVGKDYSRKLLAFARIKQIEKYFKQRWIPEGKDKAEHDFCPLFEVSKPNTYVFRITYSRCAGFNSGAEAAIYKSGAIADHVATNFLDIYKDLY